MKKSSEIIYEMSINGKKKKKKINYFININSIMLFLTFYGYFLNNTNKGIFKLLKIVKVC